MKRKHVRAGLMSMPPDLCVSEKVGLKKKGNMFKDQTYVKGRTIFVSPDSCVSKKVTLKRK